MCILMIVVVVALLLYWLNLINYTESVRIKNSSVGCMAEVNLNLGWNVSLVVSRPKSLILKVAHEKRFMISFAI